VEELAAEVEELAAEVEELAAEVEELAATVFDVVLDAAAVDDELEGAWLVVVCDAAIVPGACRFPDVPGAAFPAR